MSTMAVGEKRMKHIDDSLQKASIVLVDIEGTTTSTSFVKDTLFPYIRSNLESYLKAHWNDAEFQEDLLLLKEQAKQDEADKVDGAVRIPEDNGDSSVEAVVKNVLWQMDLDRKTKALKQLQGHIMREGYKNGKLKGHVYSDVVPALKAWAHNGRQVYIYSSGSVEAQKLLFGHSEEGDLLELFAGHFDTGVGPKVDSSSYRNIVEKLDCKSEDIVFLTDVPREAKAAQEAGLKAVLVVREGNEPLTEEDQVNFPVIKSFHDFVFEVSAKRKKMSASDEAPVIVESAANGPISEATGSSNSDRIKAEVVKKTEIANPESSGSGNAENSSGDIEMMDVSNNDAQEPNVKTDKTEKESEKPDPGVKTELAADDDLEVSKPESPAPESKNVVAAGMEKESLKPCSETAEEGDSKKVSEAGDKELESAEKDARVECSKAEIYEKEPKAEVVSTTAETTEVNVKGISASGEQAKVGVEGAKDMVSSTQDTKTDLEVPKKYSGDAESGSGGSKVNSVFTEPGSANGEPETGSGDAKAGSVNEGTEKANLEGTNDDTPGIKVDDSTMAENGNAEMSQAEEKMETETVNDKGVDVDDTKDRDITDKDAMVIEMKDEITDETGKESSAELEKKDGTLIKETDMKSGETSSVKEEGEHVEASALSKGREVPKIESEATENAESEMTLHEASKKDSSVDLSPSQTENSERVTGENKSAEITEVEPSESSVEPNAELVTTDASLEESNTKESPKQTKSASEMLQDKIPSASNANTEKGDASSKEDIKPSESKNEEEKGGDKSKAVEDATKENGLASTAENGNCPDAEENVEVKEKEQDVKVKKPSADNAGSTKKTQDDDATPMAAAASS